jgi:predicted ATPase/class 3 adenylate cyclase
MPVDAGAPVESRKIVTVVFCDLTGSTKLGESLDPETLRRVITRYFNEMKAVLARHGGTVEKFIGDAVMAAFGIPVIHEDDALRAVRAAAEMQNVMREMNRDLELEYGKTLQARIGVNTGEVIAGDSSEGHGFVSGDTVNVGARLEQAAPPGEVLIGEPTYRLVRDAVKVEAVEPLELKGKAEKMPAYKLLEVVTGAIVGTARRLDSPIVGRERELALLNETFEQTAHEKVCLLATVYATAGTGKSRLTKEFLHSLEGRGRVVVGRCLPYGEGITFWPISEVVKQLAQITEEDSTEAAAAKLKQLLPHGEEEAGVIVERVAAAIGLSEATPSAQETFWAVRKLLEYMARASPMVIVFDDIHWAEPTMLDLIEYLANFTIGFPMLILCLSRRDLLDTRPSWGTGSTTIELQPLSGDDVDVLMENLLGQARLPDGARNEIKAAAEGNPLYVEEILKMLIDEGRLAKVEDHWAPIGDFSDISIPPTIHALLSARLDRLGANEQAVIQRGSVIGKEFWWGAVSELSTEDLRAGLSHHLQALVRKELIQPDQSIFAGEDAFKFGHILIRDAAYQGLPKELRAEMHEVFGGWLEKKTGERAREYEEILGYHLEQAFRLREELGLADEHVAGLGRRASDLLASAGRRAFGRTDMHAAADLLSRATALLPPREPNRLQLSLELFDARMELGDFKGAESLIQQTVRAAEAIGDNLMEARALVLETYVHQQTGEPNLDELEVAERLRGLFEQAGDDYGLSKVHQLTAEVYWDQLNTAAALSALEKALYHARAAANHHDESKILAWMATATFWGPGHVDEGLALCEQMMETTDHLNPLVEAKILTSRSGLHAMKGEFDQARSLFAKAKNIQTEFGQTLSLAHGTQFSGLIELLADDPVAAEREFRRGYTELEEMGERPYLTTQAALLARALYSQDRYEEAERYTQLSEAAADGDEASKAEWGSTRARIMARRGELDDAERLAHEAVATAKEGDDIISTANCLVGLAEILLLSDRADEARGPIEEAFKLYESKGVTPWMTKVRALLDRFGG